MSATVFRNLIVLVLLVLVLMPGVQAQQQSDNTEATEQQPAADDATVGQQQEDTGAGSDSDLPDIDSQPLEGGQDPGPGRFIPSEQISQDFGVSFPVDI